jgi:hypothetical protein
LRGGGEADGVFLANLKVDFSNKIFTPPQKPLFQKENQDLQINKVCGII